MKAIRAMKNQKGFTLIEIMIVVLIIGILLAIAIPNFMTARKTSQAKSCIANLKQIDTATQQYAMVPGATDPPTVVLLTPYLKAWPTGCPATGVAYVAPTSLTANPVCPSVATQATHIL
ncbi:MAG: competence type IV pilus major pilin ComGC [Armatimonadota bacterium]